MSATTSTTRRVLFATLTLTSALFLQTRAQDALVDKHYDYPGQIPYQVDSTQGTRGSQTGYNICNSTTQNQQSLCQTAFLNSIDDFCLWGSVNPNSTVGQTEGEMVAWCTKNSHGSRLIAAGSLTGVQFMRTPDYVQVVGYIDQTVINLAHDDTGGEMDPHGADLRGNPLGGLMYSNAWGTDKTKFTQVIEWHNFIGSNFFCLKVCDPSRPNAAHFCEHVYDRIGCAYNAPNNAKQGVFEACEGENQDYPGVYTANGQAVTYTQPAESLGAIANMPYTARVPASSNCVTYTSAAIFQAQPTASGSSGSPSGSAGRTGSAGASAPAKTASSGAEGLRVLGASVVAAVSAVLCASLLG